MNIKLITFGIFFVFLSNILNYTLAVMDNQQADLSWQNPDLSVYQNVDTPSSSDAIYQVVGYNSDNSNNSYWGFWNWIKSLVYPESLIQKIQTISFVLGVLFMFLYYFPMAYGLFALLVKVIPFIGDG
ncbi:hypothetical protein TEU_03300 [Thermococcus eurythermalis]|uniref:Uncharacterized protein n=1 Tax=Thermococcus eurythermalis TaxID=1505907 RepID=A0A097QSH9_9EURY|nr:hypothetical protein [Thermococcus eurythermalis]AIU69450.1 hypothetical protein TEU_03300 [Thermococcus eurythermalis]